MAWWTRRPKAEIAHKVYADSADNPATKEAFRGEWLTLALSRLQWPDQTAGIYRSAPRAIGVVHQPYKLDQLVPCELILSDATAEPAESIGWFSVQLMGLKNKDPEYVLVTVSINDPAKSFLDSLDRAFLRAAASGLRFVHVDFRRDTKGDGEMFAELRSRRYTERCSIRERRLSVTTCLPNSPSWAGGWDNDL